MRKLSFAMLALAAGLAVQAMAPGAAQAMPAGKAATAAAHQKGGADVIQVGRRGGHFRGGGFRRHGFGHHGFRRHHFGSRIYLYNGGGGCYWLKKKALWTGSRYWWHRYNQCRYGW